MLYFIIITILYGLVPFLLFLSMQKRIKENPIIPCTVIVFIASLYESVGSFLLERNVELWFKIYDILVFSTIHYFYYKLLNKKYRLLFFLFIVIFALSYIILADGLGSLNFLQIGSFFTIYQTIIILVFSILWFRKIFKEFEINDLLDSPTFYYISGLLIYYCGSVVLFLLANDLYATNQNSFQYYWLINIVLNFVLRTLLIVGIWKARRV